MPRKARVIIPQVAHHIVQRGNYRQRVFETESDFRTYLYWMSRYAPAYEAKIHAYCLMGNHVHFIITPSNEKGLARLFNTVHMLYAQHKNEQEGRLGHLWQGRFFSCILSDSHLLRAVRYVEMNPVRAKLVSSPGDYLWSSARQHLEIERSPIIRTEFHSHFFEKGLNHRNWESYLLKDDLEMTQDMRRKTQKGLAIGSKEFIRHWEDKLGIILKERQAGRPKNQNRGQRPISLDILGRK